MIKRYFDILLEANTISNKDIYLEQREKGESPEDAAIFLLDILTTGMSVTFDQDKIDKYVNKFIEQFEDSFEN